MTDPELDAMLQKAGQATAPDPAALERTRQAVLASLTPVRPLAPIGIWVSALLAVFVLIAVAGGAILGMYGVRALDNLQRSIIFALLGAFGLLTALGVAREMSPAGKRLAHPALLGGIATAVFLAAFALLFPDYGVARFARGIACLRAGLIFAAPTALVVWLIVRRGFAMDRTAAGAAAGTFAGLTGLAMLELHCPILQAPHVMVWHMLVVVLSALSGGLVGWLRSSK